MHVLYDTREVHPLDRFEHARAGAAAECAPVAIRGRAPVNLLAVMSTAQVGDFAIEAVTWGADSEIVAHRTDRLIRACDPECYRIFLAVNGGVRMEQAGSQVAFRARDIALYDLSQPWQTTHTTGPVPMRVVMLTFPRAVVPLTRATVAPLAGTVMPRSLPGRSLIARFLIGLADADIDADEPGLADALRECAVGLIHQRLGRPDGITPRTRRILHTACVRAAIRAHLGDPALDPDRIAKAANISPRYLHQLFRDADLTPMRLVRQLRLRACLHSLQDPAQAMTPIKDIIAAHGYLRADQFARDFKRVFGVPATEVRRLASQPSHGREG